VIQNPSFETGQLTPGVAGNWTTNTLGQAEETASFAGDLLAPAGAYETFDHGWGVLPQQLITSLSGLTEKLAAETMVEWTVNQGVLYLAATAGFAFDAATHSAEAFEAWESYYSSEVFLPGELESGVTETFATWGNNSFSMSTEPIVFGLAGLDPRGPGVPIELFDLRVRQRMHINLGNDEWVPDHPPFIGAPGEFVTVENEGGELPEPFVENFTYVLHTTTPVRLSRYPDENYESGHAPIVNLETEGVGANFIVADPGRFWTEELQP
jgi:hypothetical protein